MTKKQKLNLDAKPPFKTLPPKISLNSNFTKTKIGHN